MSTQFSDKGVALPGSDLTVVSGVCFKVHKKNLECASSIFADMLEVGTSGSEVALVEPATVLARVLPFAYPYPIEAPDLVICPEIAIHVSRAMLKYQLIRGTEAVTYSLSRALAEAASAPPSLELATTAAQITHYFHLPEQLYKWVQYVIGSLGIIPRVEIKMRLSRVACVDEEFVNRLD
ncbi:hypothetical protein RQP46_008679 [Phenoliferia psychrophenolica]